MPTIIQPALFRKLTRSPEMTQLLEDFELITGVAVELLDPSGHDPGHQPRCPASPLCRTVQDCEAGRRLCQATVSRLMQDAAHGPTWLTCAAGLIEAAVAVRISGLEVGVLRFAGLRQRDPDTSDITRFRRSLRRAGVRLEEPRIEHLLDRGMKPSQAQIEAWLRMLAASVYRIAMKLSLQPDNVGQTLPPLVQQAVTVIRQHALGQDLCLEQIAQTCGVSPSHLSRRFHHATGMTFREYMAQFRADHAHDLLLHSDQPITAVALASGFQSVSQFNRTMRRIYGRSPRQIRQQHR